MPGPGNIAVSYAYANGNPQRLPSLAAEATASKVDVVVAEGSTAATAVRRADAAIPIVMAFSSDPVAARLVESLARPGGNTTGLSVQATDLAAKQLEILKSIRASSSPRWRCWAMQRVRPIRRGDGDRSRVSIALDLRIQRVDSRCQRTPCGVCRSIKDGRAGALLALQTPAIVALHGQIAELGIKARLPTMYIDSEFPAAGRLVSYGPNYRYMFKRSANYVDKILRGAKPRDLPFEQVERFELVINVNTARQIGLQIPSKALLQEID